MFNLKSSIQRAQRRLEGRGLSTRRKRSDRGTLRMDLSVQSKLRTLLSGHDRPSMKQVMFDLNSYCKRRSLRCPSRATLYQFLNKVELPTIRVASLPPTVKQALYNFTDSSEVPEHQLAFYCLNYGDVPAMSFAAGLPWLALYQAARMRGWRPKSRGLLRAIMKTRRI